MIYVVILGVSIMLVTLYYANETHSWQVVTILRLLSNSHMYVFFYNLLMAH